MHYRLGTLSLAAVVALSSVSPLIPFDILTASPTSQALAQSQKDREAEAHRLYQQGNQQLKNEQFREAAQSFQQVLQICRELGNRPEEAAATRAIGRSYEREEQYAQALEYFQKALDQLGRNNPPA